MLGAIYMIVDNGKYYIYRYVRLDKNVPFYIGLGTKTKDDKRYGYYTRAKAIKKGNIIWTRIINKTSYDIEILVESDDYEFIKQKEIEFIRLYGRIDKGTGYLANMTDGGAGSTGIIIGEEGRKIRSIINKGKIISKESLEKRRNTLKARNYKLTEEHKDKISITRAEPIVQYSLEGEYIATYPSIRIAEHKTGVKQCMISASLHAINTGTGGGYMWIYEKHLVSGKVEKLFKIVNKNLQGGNRSSRITIEEKVKIINHYHKLPGTITKKKCRELANIYNLKIGIVEYYVRNEEYIKLIYSDYKSKKDKFIDSITKYISSNKTNGGRISEKYQEAIRVARERFL